MSSLYYLGNRLSNSCLASGHCCSQEGMDVNESQFVGCIVLVNLTAIQTLPG